MTLTKSMYYRTYTLVLWGGVEQRATKRDANHFLKYKDRTPLASIAFDNRGEPVHIAKFNFLTPDTMHVQFGIYS